MAILTKAQLEALNQSSFPDNSTEAITPAILRTYNTATIDTLVDSLDTGSFTTDVSALNAFTASQLNINSGLNASTASQQVSINNLNSTTASINTSITNLNASSASQQISINALNAASSSYATSAITASSLVTASVSGTTLTFTKGDASTFDVTLPAGSGSSTIPTGTVSSSAQILAYNIFATTGSNTFTGNQNIEAQLTASALRVENNTYLDGTLRVTNDTEINGDLTIQSTTPNLKLRDTSGGGFSSGYDVRVDTGSFEIYDDTHNRDVLSDVFNPSTSKHTTSLTSEVIIISGSDSVTIQGALTASLAEGYVWAGNGSGLTSQVATSSFSGGTINTGSFATTGSNLFIGNQRITGSASATGNGLFGDYTLNQYPQLQTKVSTTTNPGNIYSTVGINNDGDSLGSAGIYASTFTSFGSGLVAGIYGGLGGNKFAGDGGNTAIYLHDAVMEIVKDTKVSGSLEVSSSLKVNGSPVVVSSQTGSFVTSAITASSLVTASFSGNTLTFTKGDASTFDVVIPDVSGSTIPAGTVSSSAQILNYGIFATTGSNTFIGSQTILGAASNSYNVNIKIAKNAQLSGSAYNIITQFVDTNTDPSNVYSGYELKGDDANQTNYASLAVTSYSSEYPGTPTGILIGGDYTDGTQTAFAFPLNQGVEAWKKLSAKKGLDVTGSTNIQNLTASLQQGYVWVGDANNKTTLVATSSFSSIASGSVPAGTVSSSAQILNYGIFATTASNNFVGNQNILGGQLSIQANAAGSGSLYSNTQLVIDMTTDPTNIYSAYQAVDSFNNGVFGVGINSYNSKDGGAATFNIQGGGNVSGDNTILTVNPTTPGLLKFWKPETTFNSNVAVTGSTTLRDTRITGSLLVSGAFNAIVPVPGTDSETKWFTYGGFTGNNSVVYPNASIGLQNYAGSDLDHAFVVTYANSDYTYFSGLKVGENNFGYYLGDGSGDYDYSKIEFVDNGNQTATATFKADNVNIQGATTITGATRITGSTTIVGETTLTGSLKTNNSIIFNGNSSGTAVSSTGTTSIVGSNELRTTFTRNGSSDGSTLAYVNDTGSAKAALEYTVRSAGVEAGFYVQNLSGSTTTIFNTDVAEIHGNIQIQRGSTKPSGLVSVGSSGLTVSSSIVTSNSIVLVTTQNSSIAGNEYPAVVSNKTNGSFDISHNYAGTLEVGYLIINQAP